MDMDAIKLELRLVYYKVARRAGICESLAKTAWNPKFVDVPPGRKVLVLSPHPDDDAIGLGGTIIKMVERGVKVRVVYLSLPSIDTPSLEDRRKEALKALEIMGVTDFSILRGEFPDQGLLRDLIVKETRDCSPDVIFVPSPLENHGQHLGTFIAYMEALKILDKVDTALYEVWGTIVPNMAVDITAQSKRKGEAIAAHVSQVRKVNYVDMAKGLNRYRAISSGGEGEAEAFLFLSHKDMLKAFGEL